MRNHFSHITAQQVPVAGLSAGVVDGHVDDRFQLFAHRIEHEGNAASLGFEQVAERRVLLRVFAGGEARAFREVENPHRVMAKLGAGAARGFQVLAFLFRVFGKVRLGVALHEWKAQRPPRQTDHRNPDQLLLEEKLQGANTSVEHVLQDHDVDPALVIAGDQIRVLVIQPFQTAQVPAGVAQQFDPGIVVADPGFMDMAHQPVGETLCRREGQADLEDRDREQHRAADDGVQRQQQRGNDAA